jgi:hypothetical protein
MLQDKHISQYNTNLLICIYVNLCFFRNFFRIVNNTNDTNDTNELIVLH